MYIKPRGFTIIELLVVIAIIAVLSAVLYPVLFRAKPAARKTVCISNLRQCGISLRMYMDEYDTEIPPVESNTRQLLKRDITCCQLNFWAKNCQEFGQPLIGSYAYVRSVPGMDTAPYDKLISYFRDNAAYIPHTKMPILMADIFHSISRGPEPYYAWKETADQYTARILAQEASVHVADMNAIMPDSIVYLLDDGHVTTHKYRAPEPIKIGVTYTTFRWSNVFWLFEGMYKE
ncbi:MAG: type II secretion system protein [Armatimonadota bacterium]